MNKVAYDKSPEVIGLAFPTAHMHGIKIACSSYVKNIDRVSKIAGTMHASAIPRRKRTTKRPAKFVHGI